MAPTDESDPNAPSKASGAPECVACRNPMTFVTVILDTRNRVRMRLFECKQCQSTAFIRGEA
jgi:hypothetical protein